MTDPRIECIPVTNSLFSSMTYIIRMEGNEDIWIIDPGDTDSIFRVYESDHLKIQGILLTHGHFDHIYGINSILDRYPNCMVYTNEYGRKMLQSDRLNMSKYHDSPYVIEDTSNVKTVRDQQAVKLFDSVDAIAVFTPGHNPSCITWIIGKFLFTGDAFIPGIKTVTKLPGGNKCEAYISEIQIKNLSIGRRIYPGHDLNSRTVNS